MGRNRSMDGNDGRSDTVNREEFNKFYRYITSVVQDTNPSPERTQVYYDALHDMPFELAMIAAKKVITTLENPFLPMPAVFRKAALEITQPQSCMTAAEGWEEATRAVRMYGYYREEEAMNALSPMTRKTMQTIGWKSFCTNEDEGVLRGQWRMAFETMQTRDNETARLPQGLKELIGQIGQKMIQ